MEAMIGENHGAIFEALDQWMKGSVMHIGRIILPADHLTQMVEQETQFAANNPASAGIDIFANLLLRSSFANRVDRFDPITIDHTQ